MKRFNAENRLKELNIQLPQPATPVANYIPVVRVGKLLFVSGALPMDGDGLAYRGKLGREVTVDNGYEAARLAALNCLAAVRKTLGTLNKVRRVVKVTGYVASAEGFNDQPKVMNGASDVIVEIFGEAGKHTRVAVGVYELPLGAPVEVDMILQTV
ncbi:MAG TPA: RidA family protein [Candidatus Caldiarchaeum subterraneum]|uniref:RidA family protein n=1 Tax=Caldiarchaeum subterraneum TaxID=311458 RepID=A0A833EBA3_CALS0|nr:RidA family protein [Candidatus Caldarchaeum subterraneum]